MKKWPINLTPYRPYAQKGDITQSEGWIARWQWKGYMFADWAATRKASYMRAYRALKRADCPFDQTKGG